MRLAGVAVPPPPFVWMVCFFLDLLGALPPGPAPRHLCLFPACSPASLFFFRATPGPSSAPLAPSRFRAAFWLCAVCPPVVLVGFFVCTRPFPALLPALWYPPPCTHARQHCTCVRVSVPLCARVLSLCPLGACPLAVPGHASWAPLPRVPLLSSLSSPPSPPPPLPYLLPAPLLLFSCSVCSPPVFPAPGLYLVRSHAPLGLRAVLRPVG